MIAIAIRSRASSKADRLFSRDSLVWGRTAARLFARETAAPGHGSTRAKWNIRYNESCLSRRDLTNKLIKEEGMGNTKVMVGFDLGRLPGRAINLLLRGAGEGTRPKVRLISEVADALTRELLMRQGSLSWSSQESFELDLGFDCDDEPALVDAVDNLLSDIIAIESAAAAAPAGSDERAELGEVAAFLFSIAESSKGLRPARRAS